VELCCVCLWLRISYLRVSRDIKGANLLVDASGVVKLADFGMAKLVSTGFFSSLQNYSSRMKTCIKLCNVYALRLNYCIFGYLLMLSRVCSCKQCGD
jgi:serine/threonine protein kinase